MDIIRLYVVRDFIILLFSKVSYTYYWYVSNITVSTPYSVQSYTLELFPAPARESEVMVIHLQHSIMPVISEVPG
jgi:hypothetical protein